jgi:hypothetical protein
MSRFVAWRALGRLAAVLLGAMLAFPLGILASHQFGDVPDSNTYHADIDALADAGVTTGCGDGTTFCPNAFVTREQMAAFMNRLGALAAGKTPVVNADRLDGLDSTQLVRSDLPVTGYAGCTGLGMQARTDLPTTATLNGQGRKFTADVAGSLVCDLRLPDGATVVAFTSSVLDSSSTKHADCQLRRHSNNSINVGIVLAGTGSSGNAFTGYLVATDSSIDSPAIDTETYAYVAECLISGDGANISIIGVRVAYEVGPAAA